MFILKLCVRAFASPNMPKRLFWQSIKSNKRNKVTKQVNTKSVKEVKFVAMSSQDIAGIDSLGNKYLETPIKSQNDSKDYRVVRLKNDLTALLISDVANLITLKPQEKEDICENMSVSEEEYEEEDEEEDEEEEGESEATVSGEEDDAGNTMSKKKCAMQQEKMAALGLCVGVGSFSDPWEIQGLAHFVEHMVFMGSEKYPRENDFDDFIKKRGGFDNAETDSEYTTFYFECQERHLEEAMDKFSQFFVSPLMKKEAMTREREAVESEFQQAVASDTNRKAQLLCGLAEENNPIKKFSWGNLVTLRDNVKDDHLHAAAHEFRKRHYSAHRMTLAIQARLPIDTLESWVKKYFSGVPNNTLPADDFTKFCSRPVFKTTDFKQMYWVKSVKDIYEVELTWALPSLLHMYRSKPHEYVASLIGDEGKGSLSAYLRRKVWALSMYAGSGDSGIEHNTMCTLMSINIVLTEKGFKCLKQVLDAVFGYIRLLQNVGPSERYFKELQTISEISFRYVDESPAGEYVDSLCESMQLYPPQDYITGSEMFFEYDPKAIQQIYEALRHDNVNIMVSSKKCEWEYDRTEPWFDTKYTVRDIPNDWLEDWANIKPDPSFHLPEPNKFLTTDFTILPLPEVDPTYPEKVHKDEYSEVWYRRDTKFKLPEAYMYYYFITPLSYTTPQNAAMMDLFVGMLKLHLIEEVYPAEVAELNYSIYPYDKGIMLKLSGFNEKLTLLLEAIVRHLKTFEEESNPDLFEAVKKGISQGYHNHFIKPGKLERDLRFTLLVSSHWNQVDKYTVIPKITLSMFKTFARQVLDHLYIKCLVQGNISKEQVVEACSNMVKILQPGSLLPDTHPQIRVAQLPLGQHCMRTRSFNKDSNSVITNYYQSGPIDVASSCIVDLLVLLMEEPVFDVLRTKEQLGYNVFPLLRDTFNILGFSITVNFQVTKHSPDHVDSRIEAFLKSFAKKFVKIPKEELEEVRESLIKLKQLSDVRLKDEMERNWSEITSDDYMFDRLEREVKHLQDIKKEQIKKWLDDHISCGSKKNFRKLSVQVVGHDKERIDSMTVNNTRNEISNEVMPKENIAVESDSRKNYVIHLEKGTVADKGYFISDYKSFKNGLFIYPLKCNTGT